MSLYEKRLKDAEESFLRFTKEHVLEVLDEGAGMRRLVVRANKSWHYGFTITTWHNYLAITGDIGSYTFTRLPDMFEFFRSKDARGGINPGYWEEKVVAADRHGTDEFDIDILRESIMEQYADTDDEDGKRVVNQTRVKALEAIAHVGGGHPAGDEHEAIEALQGTGIDEPWELSRRAYTIQFLNCCHAIVLAIRLYDERKAAPKKRIHTSDEAAFEGRTALAIETGALRDTGDLRLVAHIENGEQVALQVPNKWLNDEGGLAHFIREKCHPDKTVPA